MTHVATLIVDPAVPDLDAATAALARTALPSPGLPDWLAPGIAVDLPFTPRGALDERALATRLREMLAPRLIDVVVQPIADRRKRLLLADMDSTMIGQECIDEIADMIGRKAHIAAITERAMRGEIAFEPALVERVALLAGLPLSFIDEVIETRITINPGARALVRTMRANGAYTCLVSGGFTLFTARVGATIGFAEHVGNVLEIGPDKRLTGRVLPPLIGREAKRTALHERREKLRLAQHDTMVVGDGANDLAMIDEAGLGFAYHAKPAVAAAADARIDHGDLTALLYAQGYRASEFVEA
ncbi:phosphoserine phosphatase SerB [Rhodoplanes elegans]|uniref:Phosphoserine phosphatase n=1 Tax=Rhodoplanes elegans TaxID=29408 RepID=A0A327K5L6_9BRAD|nr:phosphoserine phosphatase SerB [Rhodoplanes elegans]MBK5961663.1 phosphoserine phosphatase SerB [Rhodoplanes elegans]RAI33023.1 phosphoserine phosphatase SerB [Rhodoplanes elegans]